MIGVMAHLYEQDPDKRFCAQCGERVAAKDKMARDRRCGDCARHRADDRFCTRSSARLDPPPPEARSQLSSYLGGAVAGGTLHAMPALGAMRTPLNEGLSTGYSSGRA